MNSYLTYHTCRLYGNPFCNSAGANTASYCLLQQHNQTPYSTSLAKCPSESCSSTDQKVNPGSCVCAYPYQGLMVFRAPSFSDLTNDTLFEQLETKLWTNLNLTRDSVYISNIHFNSDNYIELNLALFPSSGAFFNRSEIIRIGSALSLQTFKPPDVFGPYYFLAFPYSFSGIYPFFVS